MLRAVTFSTILCAAPTIAGPVEITIDGGSDLGAFRAPVGFLHGIDHTMHLPDLERVAELRPAYWRLAKYQTYEFVAQLEGVHVNYSVSDPYGWAVGYPNARPWENWGEWEAYVRWLVQTRTAWFPQAPIASWDVWNEPDHPYFWTGTRDQLLELFARTYAVLKEVSPDTLVVGPSLSCFDPEHPGLENIVDFLVDLDAMYGVRLDVISWHENGSTCVGGPDPRDIVPNATALRALLLDRFGPDYRPPFHINEYTGGQVHLSPGWNVGYLYNLVESGIDGAMRACWRECEDGAGPGPGAPFVYSGCWAALGGMFMFDDTTPQSAYWAYKAAADMNGHRRLATAGPSLTNALATRDETARRIDVLAGRFGGGDPADVVFKVTDYPYAADEVLVRVERIPYAWAWCDGTPQNYPLPDGPTRAFEQVKPVVSGIAAFTFPGLRDAEAYTISIVPPPCPADLDGSGAVGLADVLAVLVAWGPCGEPCPEDLDESGNVDFADLLIVLASWGECPRQFD